MERKARYVRPGELLAMNPRSLHSGPQGFFWLLGGGATPNERRGDIAIVHIRGELEHHDTGFGDSYESILKRYQQALTGEDEVFRHALEHGLEDGYKPIEANPPAAVLFCIDSPGGLVSGLNETVKAIQKIRAECGIKTIAFVNEMAASAAFALACSCEEILCPPSAILGSIGVISTVISQAKKNARDGYDVRLLTSGKRKADGHLHAPISDEAITAEMDRVNKLATAFFKLVSKSRGLSVDTIESLEAAIYLGKDAVKRGLADSVMSFDDVILGLSRSEETSNVTTTAGGNETDRRVQSHIPSISRLSAEAAMTKLDALIKKTEAALASEKDPKKLLSLAASLEAYKKTKKHVEHVETEEAPDDEPEDGKDGDGDSDDGEDEAAKHAEEESRKNAAPCGEEDDDEEESEEKAAKAALALIQSVTGMKGRAALGAGRALFETAMNTAKDVAALKQQQKRDTKMALIKGATGKYVTDREAQWLATQSTPTVKGYIEMREKSGVIVNTDETTLVKPKAATPGTEESLSPEVIAMIDDATAAFSGDKKAFRAAQVQAHLVAHTARVNSALNHQGGF